MPVGLLFFYKSFAFLFIYRYNICFFPGFWKYTFLKKVYENYYSIIIAVQYVTNQILVPGMKMFWILIEFRLFPRKVYSSNLPIIHLLFFVKYSDHTFLNDQTMNLLHLLSFCFIYLLMRKSYSALEIQCSLH